MGTVRFTLFGATYGCSVVVEFFACFRERLFANHSIYEQLSMAIKTAAPESE
jgi:hypothetical protein